MSSHERIIRFLVYKPSYIDSWIDKINKKCQKESPKFKGHKTSDNYW